MQYVTADKLLILRILEEQNLLPTTTYSQDYDTITMMSDYKCVCAHVSESVFKDPWPKPIYSNTGELHKRSLKIMSFNQRWQRIVSLLI